MNERTVHELVKYLSANSLLSLRATCKRVEQTLSSNSDFVEKALLETIYTKLGKQTMRIELETNKVRIFVKENVTEANDRYQFARDIIRVSEQTRCDWEERQKYDPKRAARDTFWITQKLINQNWEKSNQFIELDDQYDVSHAQAYIGSMFGKLSDLHIEINCEEEANKEPTKKEVYQGSKAQIKKQKRIDDHTKQNHITELRFRAVYSANILQLLITKMIEIQRKHLNRMINNMTNYY